MATTKNTKSTGTKKKRSSRKGKPSPNKGKSLINFKDVQICFMSEGVEGVRNMHSTVEDGLSKSVLWAAINKMPAAQDTEALRAFAVELYGVPSQGGGRGRSAPTVGTSRAYKAQQIKDGGPFLRLPLDTLGAEKGQSIGVHFEEGRIVVDLNVESIAPAAPTGE